MQPADEDIDDFFQFDGADAAAEPAPASSGQPRAVPPRLGLLANLSDEEFDRVARAAQLKFLDEGIEVFRQGDAADRFFILVDGQLDVIRDGTSIAHLGPGAFFGESALLTGHPRNATVATLMASALWSVDYAVFDEAMAHHLLADEMARREIEARLQSTPGYEQG